MRSAGVLALLLLLGACTSTVPGRASAVCADPADAVPLTDGVEVPVGACLVLEEAGLADPDAPAVVVDGTVLDVVERDDERLVLRAVTAGETVVRLDRTDVVCEGSDCRDEGRDEDLAVTVVG